jgi:hypothetical protein
MIKGFEHTGQWWLPNEPENKIPGTLKYDHKQGAMLELIGSFENRKDRYKDKKPLVILGTSSNGNKVSLHDCSLFSRQGIYQGFTTCSYFADMVFVGTHFHNTEDAKFRNINARYSCLDEWVDISGLSFTHSKEEDVIIRYKKPDDIRVDIGGDFSIIITQVLHTEFARVQKKAGVEQKWIVRIETVHEASFESFYSIIQHLQSFLCLAVREPVHVLDIEGETEANKMTDINCYPPVGIFYKSPYISEPPESSLGWYMLFTYQDISADFGVLLRNWFEKADVLRPICGLYLGILYNPHLYLENQFLSLVQAIEAFHRRIFKGRYLPKSEYKKLVFTPLVNMIPDVNRDLQESLKSKLGDGNEHSLRTRLNELLDKCGKIVPQLLGNRRFFINKTVHTRNYHTHYDKKLYKYAAQGTELVSLTKKLRILLEVCLITQTGLDVKKAKDFFGRHRRIPEEAFGQFSSVH